MTSSAGPVVVGIDGSRAAIRAAEWAIDEAITRNVPLRLVHVIHVGESSIDQSELPMELEYGESALRDAVATVKAARKPVKTDTEVLYGSVDTALVTESLGASMICVGSVGIGRMSRMLLGSTATALA